ncbi:MAG: hypothetical protein ACRDV8_01245, partial [Acidimicrobiales bacterium]
GAAGYAGGAAGYAGGAAELALQQTFIGLSQQQGAVTKSVTADTFNSSGDYYAEVIGLNGASSPTAFTITVTRAGTSCSTVPFGNVPTTTFPTATGGTLSGKGTDYSTVVVTDSETMPTVTKTAALSSEIGKLASTTTGVVVDVGKSTAVRALTAAAQAHPSCPYAVNLEADAIQNIVNSYRKGTGTNLRYVVIVGGDTVIPFFRYADQEKVEPESDFTQVISLTTHTEAEAALQDDYYLTDDPYGAAAAIPIDGSTLPLQSAAVGRLVQSPTEIAETIARYLTTRTGKVIKVSSSLSAGYSFMAKPAQTIAATFASEGVTGTNNTQLITNDGVPTSTIGTPPTKSWTAAQLSQRLTAKSHQLVFIGAHFNSKIMLAADHTSGTDTYLTTSTFSDEIGTHLQGALVLSAGCHSGYNVNPADSVLGTTVAWPEAFAGAGATLIAGSGYQYSDVNYVADSDQVYADLATQLDYAQATGGVHIGTALLHTEWEYLASLEALDGLSEKSLLQVTLYGLPMLGISIGTSAPQSAPGASASVIGGVTEAATGPGGALGLGQATLHLAATITPTPIKPSTTVGTATRVYYKGPSGDTSEPGTPVVPVQTVNVSVPDKTLRGVGLWKGTYSDTSSAQPMVGDPASETAPTPPTFSSSVYAPANIWNPNYFGTLTNGTGTTLGVTPIQYVTTPSDPARATMRTYRTLTFALFYSSATGTAADASAPGISDVTVTTTATTATVTATVPDNEAAGVQEVWTTYTYPGATGTWTSTLLTETPKSPDTWKASFALAHPDSSDFVVQAVNGVGEVSMDDDTGAYFTPSLPGNPTPAAYTLSLPVSASGAYGATATVTASLTATTSSGDAAHRPISFAIGSQEATAYTAATGTATARISLGDLVPGTYSMSASFGGDGADAPAHASSTFQVTMASSTLTVSAPSALRSGGLSGVSAKLASGGAPLGQESVFFSVTSPTGAVVATSVGTTTDKGIAQAGMLELPAGDVGPGYTLHAYFATSTTPVSATGTVNASLVGYDPATASSANTTTVTDATRTTLVAAPSPGTFGKAVKLTATVAPTGTSSSTWPTGAGAAYPTGSITFENGSTVLGTATLALSSAGVDTAILTVTGLQGGTHTLTALDAGSTYLTASSAVAEEAIGFTETISGSKSGSLVITSGETVLITGKVSGSISVEPGGGLEIEGGKVSGAISATGATGFTLCGATVSGAMSVSASTGSVLIGGGTTGCAKSKISGAISLSGNKGPVELATSTISGPVSLSGNTGSLVLVGSTISGSVSVSGNRAPTGTGIEISANKISGSLSCSGNAPAPTDAGKANTVAGARSGQCDSPKTF